jgi:hypothetical protein
MKEQWKGGLHKKRLALLVKTSLVGNASLSYVPQGTLGSNA